MVNPPPILKQVMKAISHAQFEILATMNAAEEIQTPLPPSYFALLMKKMNEGVTIKRLILHDKLGTLPPQPTHPNYQSRNCQFYQRMILIDRKKLFFKQGKTFHTTQDQKIISKYLSYFEKEFQLK